MFGHGIYYFSHFRSYVIYFGNLFNDLSIKRTDSDGTTTSVIKIPLQYAHKDKFLARVDADPTIQRADAITLPAMSFEMTGIQYDQDRKLNQIHRKVLKSTDPNKLKRQFTPVPYNIGFRLHVYVKNTEDGTKIVEQILPAFTPAWTSTLNLVPEMEMKIDIPVILNNVSFEDNYAGDFVTRRAIIWTFDFTVKGYFYGPIVDKPVVKVVNTQFYVPDYTVSAADGVGNTNVIGRVTVTPGLDANGNPTSNAEVTVPWSEIEIDDDFGYVVDVDGQIAVSNT